MAQPSTWREEDWLPLLRLYLTQPEGVKPIYSRPMVSLAMSLHVEPRQLHARMMQLRRRDEPSLAALWQRYAADTARLDADIARLRRMEGFGCAKAFYAGVAEQLTWERTFMPLPAWMQLPAARRRGCRPLTPAALTIILNLYYHLTPATMTAKTPEVAQTARLLHTRTWAVTAVMDQFRSLDPILPGGGDTGHPLWADCREVWARYGNQDYETLAALAAQLRDYYADDH